MTPYQKKQNIEMDEYVNHILDDTWSFEDKVYIQSMRDYIINYCPTKEEAEAALIRTGILNEDGSRKEHICNILSE